MSVEVLITTMNQRNHEFMNKINIKTNAIVCNQTDCFEEIKFELNGNKIRFFSFNERGVGLNRNNGLMRAKGDILLIADDDLVFDDNYESKVLKNFEKFPKADVIIFNLKEENSKRYRIKKPFRVRRYNYMRFGAARLAIKTKKVTYNNIFFNIHFGGGTKISAGEDVLFLKECLDKGLVIMAVPDSLATLTNERDSTWFEGYNEKFFIDKGKLYKALSSNFSWLLAIRFCLKHRKLFKQELTSIEALKFMLKGIRNISYEK
ncbi:glycosyltransferase [Bhargavaea beijingensis]|uniref:glycosyltransferase n=1 Tax=Bhargavaea beijingensis TaxID=426756 RepID=UPI0022251768|nr:glycosyltransferase [Bhargavaea beijingensis]MCW1929091.1 glycosyltransferase [Bhargavaea beijingensis]